MSAREKCRVRESDRIPIWHGLMRGISFCWGSWAGLELHAAGRTTPTALQIKIKHTPQTNCLRVINGPRHYFYSSLSQAQRRKTNWPALKPHGTGRAAGRLQINYTHTHSCTMAGDENTQALRHFCNELLRWLAARFGFSSHIYQGVAPPGQRTEGICCQLLFCAQERGCGATFNVLFHG